MREEGLYELLSYWVQRSPNATAMVYGETDMQSVSYKEFLQQVEDLRDQLMKTSGTCIGILTTHSMECICTIFAANLAGWQVVLLDPMQTDEELGEKIQATNVDYLWGNPNQTKLLEQYLTEGVTEGRDQILFFTSGTTSRSKAVVLTGQSLCQSAYNGSAMLPLKPEDRLLCLLPLHHVFGFVCSLLWGLYCGATIALGRGPRHYVDDCAYYKPTAISLVPLILEHFMAYQLLNEELKVVLIGAGGCPKPLLKKVQEQEIFVSFGYGLTETSSGVAISIGEDPYAMSICPDDTISLANDGEILIQAPTCMMKGYYHREKETMQVLKDGWLHTGDMGRIDEEGRIYVTGRKKEMLVLLDGTKLFLPEYEEEIRKLLEHQELAITLKQERPVLVYIGDAERKDLQDTLSDYMKTKPRGQQLADIIFLNEPLPRTETGKIKRWVLQQKVSER